MDGPPVMADTEGSMSVSFGPETVSIAFGPFVLDRRDQRIHGPEGAISIGRNAFRLLERLLEGNGQLVTKEELIEAVWSRIAISDSALASTVKEIRRALGDPARSPRLIESVYGRGYRMLVNVVTCAAKPAFVGNLTGSPPPASHLVGRADSIAVAERLLHENPALSINGPVGVGKSAFAKALARRWQQERGQAAWLVDLADIDSDPAVISALAHQTGYPERNSDVEGLLAALSATPGVVIFDHADRAMALLGTLTDALSSQGRMKVIIIARGRGPRTKSASFHLAPLSLNHTSEMIARAAGLQRPIIDPARDKLVTNLARLSGGLPLVANAMCAHIERRGLEATGSIKPEAILELPVAGGEIHAATPTLADRLGAALALCGEDCMEAVRALTVFRSSFRYEAAKSVLAALEQEGRTADETLRLLRDNGFVVPAQVETADRAVLPAPIGLLAIARTPPNDWREAAFAALVEYQLGFLKPLWQEFCGSPMGDEEFQRKYLVERENTRGALDWLYESGELEQMFALLNAGVHLWRGEEEDILPFAQNAFDRLARAGSGMDCADALVALTILNMPVEPVQASRTGQAALPIAPAGPDALWQRSYLLAAVSYGHSLLGNLEQARGSVDELIAIIPAEPPCRGLALALSVQSLLAYCSGNVGDAQKFGQAAALALIGIGARGTARVWQACIIQALPEAERDTRIERWSSLIEQLQPTDLAYKRILATAVLALSRLLLERHNDGDDDKVAKLLSDNCRLLLKHDEREVMDLLAHLGIRLGHPRASAWSIGYVRGNGRATTRMPTFHVDMQDQIENALGYSAMMQALEQGASLPVGEVTLRCLEEFGSAPSSELKANS